jgi:hypothetical protein
MANGNLKRLNQSLEITVQDSLDGLEDFTLQMAYATTDAQFEILSIDSVAHTIKSSPATPVALTLIDNAITDVDTLPAPRRKFA